MTPHKLKQFNYWINNVLIVKFYVNRSMTGWLDIRGKTGQTIYV